MLTICLPLQSSAIHAMSMPCPCHADPWPPISNFQRRPQIRLSSGPSVALSQFSTPDTGHGSPLSPGSYERSAALSSAPKEAIFGSLSTPERARRHEASPSRLPSGSARSLCRPHGFGLDVIMAPSPREGFGRGRSQQFRLFLECMGCLFPFSSVFRTAGP